METESASTTLYLSQVCADLEGLDDGAKVELTMIETEKFGTGLSSYDDINVVTDYIENRFDEVLAEESRIRRNPRFKDGRIDVCIYFIEPTTHGLNELDIITLRQLSPIVNIVPVLARADQLTESEKLANKRLIQEDLKVHDISIYDFKFDTIAEEDETAENELREEQVTRITDMLPFALTSSSEIDKNKAAYIRKLSYGTVDILDPEQSNYLAMKQAVFNDYRIELKERAHYSLYETYRTKQLDPQKTHRSSLLMPQELAEHSARLKQAQLQREAQRLKDEDARVNLELERKRALLLQRENELRELERKMTKPESSNDMGQLQDEIDKLEQQQALIARELSRENMATTAAEAVETL